MSIFDRYGFFLFANDETLSEEEQQMEEVQRQEMWCELMHMYQQYHGIIKEQQYALRGSKLVCQYGTQPARLDCIKDYGIRKFGLPVFTIHNCTTENIHSFGCCRCPEDNYRGRLPMTVASGPNTMFMIKPLYNVFPHLCVPLIDEEHGWKQIDQDLLVAVNAQGYAPMLMDNAVLVCQYGGIIFIKEVSDSSEESLEQTKRTTIIISSWLTAYEGRPARTDGTSIDLQEEARVTLGDENYIRDGQRHIDWYSYENYEVEGDEGNTILTVNKYAIDQYEMAGKEFVAVRAPNGGFVNEEGRYWVAVGPEVVYPGYNTEIPEDEQTLSSSQFEYGTEIDVVLKYTGTKSNPGDRDKIGEIVYIECIVGDVKAHTHPHGVFQTGEKYPKCSNTDDGSEHRNGSYIEFINAPVDNVGEPINGDMSGYVVIDILVYERDW